MKVFVAGATGVLGKALVPLLVAGGHEVVGMTRSAAKQDLVRSLGAHPVVADALDPDTVAQVVASTEPEVIVHELTALSGKVSLGDARHPERSYVATMTNRLRIEATDHLLAAGCAVGARRFVAQSFAAFRWARTGGPVLTEEDPIDPNPPAPLRGPLVGILHVERTVPTIEWGEGLVLRYGGFYGPGTAISRAPDAAMAAPVRKRRFPIVGDGGGVFRMSTSTTPRPRPSSQSITASRASTTLSTTSPRRFGSGYRCWRARCTPSHQGISHAGWRVSRPVRRQRS